MSETIGEGYFCSYHVIWVSGRRERMVSGWEEGERKEMGEGEGIETRVASLFCSHSLLL